MRLPRHWVGHLENRIVPKQVHTSCTSLTTIMRHPNFARGWADIRAGQPFNPEIDDVYWAYERGRLLGAIAPLTMELRHGKALNPKATALFEAACNRKLIT